MECYDAMAFDLLQELSGRPLEIIQIVYLNKMLHIFSKYTK